MKQVKLNNETGNKRIPIHHIITFAFLLSYILCFVIPIFFNKDNVMIFPQYLPAKSTIGLDLRSMQFYVGNWFYNHQSPYFDGFVYYPPFAILFFLLFTVLPFKFSYILLNSITIALFVFVAFYIPNKIFRNSPKAQSFVLLFFFTAFTSYGLQFEIERGQFNFIAFSCAFLAIYIFHFHKRYRIASYILISIAMQMKVYPLIFIFCLIDQKDEISTILKRYISIGVANFLLLFLLGWNIFLDFLNSITYQLGDPQIWVGNHSAKAFVSYTTELFLNQNKHQRLWIIEDYQNIIFISLFLIILACIIISLYFVFRHRLQGFQPNLILILTTAALIIPSVSHDYTLSLLPVPLVLFIGEELSRSNEKRKKLKTVLIALIVFCYGITLFSYSYKIIPFKNNFPVLLSILILSTIHLVIDQTGANQPITES